VARDLARRGHTVTAVDAAPTLLSYAQEADPIGRYLVADAAALPFSAETFDIVVAYNVLMDIQDMPGAVREAARVLAPGGRFCICVTHPLHDVGRFAGREEDAAFTISGSYLGRRPYKGTVEQDGLRMTFRGWCYALEEYARAIEEAGLCIDRLREPAAPAQAVAQRASWRRWQRVPMFLHLRAIKN
jgi:SAM-dependent methyltransferase